MVLGLMLVAACSTAPEEPAPGASLLRVDTPAPGAWVAPGEVVVSGQAFGLTELTVNGASAEIVDGAFRTTVEVPVGVHALEVAAKDLRGDTVFTRGSVIAGDFVSVAEGVRDGVAVRVDQEGLDTVVGATLGLLDLDAVIAGLVANNPLVEDTLFGVPYALHLTELSLAPLSARATLEDGHVALGLVVDDLHVVVRATGAFGLLDTSVSADVDRITADVDLALRAVGGGLDATLGPVELGVEGFAFDASLIPGGFEDEIPFLSDMLRDFVVQFAEEQVRALAPSLIDGVEDALALSFDVPLLERVFSVDGAFRTVEVTPAGAVIGLDLAVAVDEERPDLRYAGMLSVPRRPHRFPAAPVAMSLHDDLLNRLLFEAWRGGLLSLSLTSDDEPLLGLLFVQLGSTEGGLAVDARLPPVALEGPDGLEVQIGELDLTITTPGGTYGESVRVRVTGTVPLAPRIRDGALGVALGTPTLSLMVVETDWRADPTTISNLLLDQLPIDTLLGLAGAFDFPLPVFAGLSIDHADAARAASGVHTTVGITLGVEAAP